MYSAGFSPTFASQMQSKGKDSAPVSPQDILPDGVEQTDVSGITIRMGTIAAFAANARLWSNPATEASARAKIEQAMIQALPALRVLGVLDVFVPRDERLKALIDAHESRN